MIWNSGKACKEAENTVFSSSPEIQTVNTVSCEKLIGNARIRWSKIPFAHPVAPWDPIISVRAHDDRFHFFGGSPFRHQKVDHSLRLDEQVAAEEKDPEYYSEGEYAHHRDLNYSHDEETPLVRRARREAVVRHHRWEVTAQEDLISLVGEDPAVRLIKCSIHVHFTKTDFIKTFLKVESPKYVLLLEVWTQAELWGTVC